MINLSKKLIAVIMMAAVTYLIRVIPIAICRTKIKSRFIKSFLYYIPFAVLGAMTFPSILFSTSNIYYSIIGTATALILAYFEKGLLTVALSSVLAVYLCGLIF
ncbi:AzlD domain-containing protein [Anaerosalibacter sp. Marseille-P3206]|uniref:AzlD domain-containing protein n=1 Tax=Anaerosalibacter sp. Marseille-P3206 TaxID=1871005 RepID=UPI0009870269